jgi:cytochrome c oxidase subunit II
MATQIPALADRAGWTLQHALSPAGPQAAQIHDLWQFTLWLCVLVGGVVFAAFAWALWRAQRGTEDTPPIDVAHATEQRGVRVVAAAILVVVVGLFALVTASVMTDRALASLPRANPLTIELTGHQWWWEARYEDRDPSRTFSTANELHVPVGRPVLVKLLSGDVIHSFWVPRLHGKADLIPGRTNTIQFRADEAGVYRGQCAEFCGYQHAFMAFLVVADAPDEYERWAERQRGSAIAPSSDAEKRGQQVFLQGTCVMCHAVQGTDANARFGPDLTHVGGRQTIAAGTLPNQPQHLAHWIVDPQAVKPGVNMPPNRLAAADLDALVAYLTSLK